MAPGAVLWEGVGGRTVDSPSYVKQENLEGFVPSKCYELVFYAVYFKITLGMFRVSRNSSLTNDGDGISTCISESGASAVLFFRT
ncbi:hypothetical protein Q9966_008389 [Columba livia]|nr:hypothetical protein Q9966_008389 [Columba livia]